MPIDGLGEYSAAAESPVPPHPSTLQIAPPHTSGWSVYAYTYYYNIRSSRPMTRTTSGRLISDRPRKIPPRSTLSDPHPPVEGNRWEGVEDGYECLRIVFETPRVWRYVYERYKQYIYIRIHTATMTYISISIVYNRGIQGR